MFECDKCGLCCIGLNKSEVMADMHNGDGICIHLNLDTMCCKIYKDRPIFCRVEDYYDTYLTDKMEKEEFMRLNYEACELKKKEFKECEGDIYKMISKTPDLEPEYKEIVNQSLSEAEKKTKEEGSAI